MRVDTGGDIVKQRLGPRAESSEGLKTNGAKVHTVGERLVFTKLCASASSATERAALDAAGM